MKIVTLNGWEKSAETEIEKRIAISLRRLGHECFNVRTSQEINEINPDLVISLSYHFAKLTDHPTILALWSPVSIVLSRGDFVKNLLSFDGYLYANERLQRQAEDICFSAGKPFHGIPFHASVHSTEFNPAEFERARLIYAGTNWESRAKINTSRYQSWLNFLRNTDEISICGPTERWDYDDRVIDDVPFDGESLLDVYREHGLVLCLHSRFHREENLPTVRPFEAIAAGCLPIIDKLKFYEDQFGDDAFYIDPNFSDEEASCHLAGIKKWVVENPMEARARSKRLHAKFVENFSYDVSLKNVSELLGQILESSHYLVPDEQKRGSEVTYIVRCGGRSSDLLRRCLESLSAQTSGPPNVLLVKHGKVDDLDSIESWAKSVFPSVEIMELLREGPKSIRLWAALNSITTRYFALLDDDDAVHRNHLASLLDLADGDDDSVLWYSGTIRCWEGIDFAGDGAWKKHKSWPTTDHHPDEERYITLFEDHKPSDLWSRNYVASPSYIGRTSALRGAAGTDPRIGTAEDWTLVALLAKQGDFRFSYRATAEWFWRKSMSENATFGKQGRRWLNLQRIKARTDVSRLITSKNNYNLSQVNFPDQTYRDVEFKRDDPGQVQESGWFTYVQVSKHIALVYGEASFDGLDYSQNFSIHHPSAFDLAALKVHCIKQSIVANSDVSGDEAPIELTNSAFRKFIIKLGTPDDLSASMRDFRVVTSDGLLGRKSLRQTRGADAKFQLSVLQKHILSGETADGWLNYEADGLTLGRSLTEGLSVYGIHPKFHNISPTIKYLSVLTKHVEVDGTYIENAEIRFVWENRQRSIKICSPNISEHQMADVFDLGTSPEMAEQGWKSLTLNSLQMNSSLVEDLKRSDRNAALILYARTILWDNTSIAYRLNDESLAYLKHFSVGLGHRGANSIEQAEAYRAGFDVFGYMSGENVEQIQFLLSSLQSDHFKFVDLMGQIQRLPSGYFLKLRLAQLPFWDLDVSGGQILHELAGDAVMLSISRIKDLVKTPDFVAERGDTARFLRVVLENFQSIDANLEMSEDAVRFVNEMQRSLGWRLDTQEVGEIDVVERNPVQRKSILSRFTLAK